MERPAPHGDLTAERAAKLYVSLNAYIPTDRCVYAGEFNQVEVEKAEDIAKLTAALKTARQEALREAIDKVTDRALLWRSHGGAKMAFPYGHLTVEGECDVIASILDRLASEEL